MSSIYWLHLDLREISELLKFEAQGKVNMMCFGPEFLLSEGD